MGDLLILVLVLADFATFLTIFREQEDFEDLKNGEDVAAALGTFVLVLRALDLVVDLSVFMIFEAIFYNS